jgi:two-component system nitrogen regulation sensor histidine kinase NtrY
MTLSRRLQLYVVGLHVLLFAFTLVLLREQTLLFMAVEVLLLISLGGGFALVRRAMQPLDYTERFRGLLQERDYAARLTTGNERELDELVELFNGMLATLYRERLALGEQRGFLERLLEATPSAVLVFDFDGGISLMNASAQAMLGLAQASGKPLAHWLRGAGDSDGDGAFAPALDAPARARTRSLLAQLDALPLGESRLLDDPEGRRYRGQRGQFMDRGFARHFVLVEELTDELERSERATYDKLVRVLAHEVNNTVAATGSVLDSLLYYRAQLAERDGEDFSTAIVAVKRRNASLGEFIERFTRVIKMPEPELRPTSVRALMDDILYLNRELCRSRGIRIGWGRCDEVGARMMDAPLMEQALLNIVKNAVEAVEAAGAGGGDVELSLAHDGERARLSVSDSGKQLGAVPARQLFTPFFSTKKGGQGIGLMFVREVLVRHGFDYRLEATPDGRTHFDIWFPAVG